MRWTMPGRRTPLMPDRLSSGVEQAVDQGVVPMPSCRMDDQTLGLVDHQEILVFIGNFPNPFWWGLHPRGSGSGSST